MKQIYAIFLLLSAAMLSAQEKFIPIHEEPPSRTDTFPHPIPFMLDPVSFIPRDRLTGLAPWIYGPVSRPVFEIIVPQGFVGSVGFGEYTVQHPDKFFSTLEGYNTINIPQMYLTEQMMMGNTFRLARNFYMFSGILYGAQLGVLGNNWGMGTREGFIWTPSSILTLALWNQYYQSVSVYSPVGIADSDSDGAAVKMPATPEVFSFGAQASFVVGEFIIGIGTSVTPKPPDPKKSRYR